MGKNTVEDGGIKRIIEHGVSSAGSHTDGGYGSGWILGRAQSDKGLCGPGTVGTAKVSGSTGQDHGMRQLGPVIQRGAGAPTAHVYIAAITEEIHSFVNAAVYG